MDIFVGVDEVASILSVKPATIKKYYLAIEEKGYRFKRTNQGRLSFSQTDIEMFRKIIQLKNQPGIKVEDAIKQVVASTTTITVYQEPEFKQDTASMPNIEVITAMAKQIEEMKKMMTLQHNILKNQQKELIELKEENKNSQRLIENKISERDKMLMESLRTMQEIKQMMTVTQKKRRWKFWKK